jgi:hypothetical protein
MSQAGRYNSNTPAPGTVLSLEGNTGAAVGPDGGGTIFVVGSGDISVAGNPLTNTLTISDSGGGGGITTIDGNVGSVAGATVTLMTPGANGDGTALFTGDGSPGTVMTLTFSDEGDNIGLGINSVANAFAGGGQFNCAVGAGALQNCAMGFQNVAMGLSALQNTIGDGSSESNGSFNTAIGSTAGEFLVSGGFNILLGADVGSQYTGAESNNILIGNQGVTAESNVIRIGTDGSGQAQQNLTYIAGIQGVTPSSGPTQTVIIGTDGQLGSTSSSTTASSFPTDSGPATPSAGALTIHGGLNLTTSGSGSTVTVAEAQSVLLNNYTAVNHAASPYTVLATDYYISADVTAGVITINLPNAPTTNRVFIIKDKVGLSGTSNITVTTVGGAVTIDGAATLVMNTNYESVNLAFNGVSYEAF